MSKVMTMKEAVSQFVQSGDTVFLSGAQHGEPAAAIHEIVRQRIDHLSVICALVTTVSFMIGEGLIDEMITGYSQQDTRTYTIQRAKENNPSMRYKESSHFGIALALHAGQLGIPFIPTRCLVGSDLMTYNEDLSTVEDPFTGEKLGAVKAVVPDVGIIHVQRCDELGNAQKWGSLGVDYEGINASKKVIVTTEKIVDSSVIRSDPNRTIIPGFRVNAVVEQPWGAYPMHMAGCYAGDMFGFMQEAGSEESYKEYIDKLIFGIKDWNEYMKLMREKRGEEYFSNLEIKEPKPSVPIIMGF
ncbi:MAG: CoA transferase subunit A [Dehalococcoidales bacterium]|nr:CoA transferase subunit A [Dehalococcoidales bacterium]